MNFEPKWMQVARKEIGIKEIPGSGNHPRIVEYHQSTSLKSTLDEVPWCSAFVNWCLWKSGMKGTNSARAKSFLEMPAQLVRPVPGCIVVFWRGNPEAATGHVAFFVSETDKSINVLGGNQSDQVKISPYTKERVLGYFWPIEEVENGTH